MAAAAAAAYLTRVAGEASEERTSETPTDGRISLLRLVDDVHGATLKEVRLSGPQHFLLRVACLAKSQGSSYTIQVCALHQCDRFQVCGLCCQKP